MNRASVPLWALFALLLLFGAARFLFACGFAAGDHVWNYCPAQVDHTASLDGAARTERLQRLIHVAELRLAEKPACGSEETHQAETDRVIRRGYERGAQRGMLEVFLAWRSYDDLDLVVFCPNGNAIGGLHHEGGCGDGRIDLDANANLTENRSLEPTEHAVWLHDIPDGAYRIGAYLYKADNPNVSQTIPFKLIFKLGDRQRECHGEVQYFPKSARLAAPDGEPLFARDYYVDWSSGSDLPACNLSAHDDAWCDDHSCQAR